MDSEHSARIIELLESIDGKLGVLEDMKDTLDSLRMELCGFQHQGKSFPSIGDRILTEIEGIGSALAPLDEVVSTLGVGGRLLNEIESIGSSLSNIDANTSS